VTDAAGTAHIDGLDGYALLDAEAARLERFFESLPDADWLRPSRCAGWSVRDLLAHLAGGEDYFRACLDDDLDGLLAQATAAGATDLHSMTAWAIRQRADRSAADVLQEWRSRSAASRAELRARGDGTVTTMVGPYPARLQALHIAAELATHADDAGVPVEAAESADRLAWRAAFSRFALAEADRPVSVEARDGDNRVRAGDEGVVLSDADLVEAVAARPTSVELTDDVRRALSTMP